MQHEQIAQPENPELDIRLSVAGSLQTLASLEDWLTTPDVTGVTVSADDDYSALREHLGRLETIAIEFADATDGRGFTIARSLRDWGYLGELRATGRFVRDQLHYLRRCGFDAFELPEGLDPKDAARNLYDFSIRYQTVADSDRRIHFLMR